jgi:WD40 repeat protein
MAILKWIQLSDLHLFYRNFDTTLHRYALVETLKHICSSGVDLLFITGDIGYKGKYDEDGINLLKEIISTINCPPERIFIVPGNHDLRRSAPRDIAIQNARIDFENVDIDDWDFLSLYGFKKFSSIYKEITGKNYGEIESDVCYVNHLDDLSINVIHINTSATAGKDDDTGNLRVCNSRFVEKLQKINKEDINIAIGHHGLDFIDIHDKTKLLQCFNQYNILIYLCGHSHQLGENIYGKSSTFIFQELTCGGLLQDDYNESSFIYGIIDTSNRKISADMYQYDKAEWKIVSKLHCPISNQKIEIEKPIIISEINSNKWLNCFFDFFRRMKDYGDIYSYLQIDDILFGDMEMSNGGLYKANNIEVPLLRCLLESWNIPDKNNLIVVGEGGMGKTVSMLKTWEILLFNKNIISIYISLFEINETETWFQDYLYENVFFKDTETTHEFIKHIECLYDVKQPYFVLFLDGFNEVNRTKQINIIRTIRNLQTHIGYQVILSSRFDMGLMYGLSDYLKVVVKPLTNKQIDLYTKKFNVDDSLKQEKFDILKVPLMLTLYTQTARLYQKFISAPQIKWLKNSNTKGGIIYNYLQCQIAKQLDQLCTPDKTFMSSVAINYILPYIGWRMEIENVFSIDEDYMLDIFETANKKYKNMCVEETPSIIVLEKRNCGAAELTWDSDLMWELLNNELHLFNNHNNRVAFMHQELRDCLAAIHLVNDLYFSEIPKSWDEKLISDDVIKYIVDLFETKFKIRTLYQKIELLRNKNLSGKYFLRNMLRIIAQKQHDDLSTVDFSDLDLREVLLSNYTFVKGERKSCFKNAKLSDNTFLQNYHKKSITSVAYSCNGDYYVSSSADSTIKIWDSQTNQCVQLLKTNGTISKVKFSLDSDWLISVGTDRVVKIWNWRTKQSKSLGSHGNSISEIICLNDGETCITISLDATIRIWNIIKSKLIKVIDLCKERFTAMAYVPEKNLILCGTDKGNVCFFEATNFEKTEEIKVCDSVVTGIAISTESGTFAISNNMGEVKIWDINSLLLVNSLQAHSKRISQIIYNSNTKEYISVSPDRNTIFWDSTSGNQKTCLNDEKNCINCISSSPNGKYLLQGTIDGLLKILNINSKECIYEQIKEKDNSIRCMALTGDKKYCLTAMEDCSIKKWDIETGIIVREYTGHKKPVNSISCAHKTNHFITACQDSKVRIWDLDIGKCVSELQGHAKPVNKAVFTYDEMRCVSVSDDKTMRIWNISDGKEIRVETALRACTDVDVNSETIVSSALDNRIRGWTFPKLWRAFTKRILDDGVFSVVLSPISKQFASLHNNKIYIWKTNSEQPVMVLGDEIHTIKHIIYTTDGMHIVGGCENGDVCVWDLISQTCSKLPDKHYAEITGISIISENKCITSSKDGMLKIWDIFDLKCIKTINVPNFNLSGCIFSDAVFESETVAKYIKENGGII